MTAIPRESTVLAGLANQLRREAAFWWGTGRWWRQALIWTALLSGMFVLMVWVVPGIEEVVAQTGTSSVPELAAQFTGMAAVVTAAGVILLSQGMLLDEQRAGTTEWLLSKPLSRPALLLAKLAGHASGLLVAAVLIPWTVVYVLLSIADDRMWPVSAALGAAGLLGLLVVFHLSLVLLLSVVAGSRVVVLALPLAALLGADLVMTFVPETIDVLPWALSPAAGALLAADIAPPVWPVLATVGWSALATALALWRFNRQET